MRLAYLPLGLCAVLPLVALGAAIDKSQIGRKKSERTKSSSSKSSSSSSITVANPESKFEAADSKPTDVENDADADADSNADVVFVSGANVANFSEKSQKQVFNQIVPLANVKDFYGESDLARL